MMARLLMTHLGRKALQLHPSRPTSAVTSVICELAERLHVGGLANKSRFPKNRRDPVRCDRLHLAGGAAAL